MNRPPWSIQGNRPFNFFEIQDKYIAKRQYGDLPPRYVVHVFSVTFARFLESSVIHDQTSICGIGLCGPLPKIEVASAHRPRNKMRGAFQEQSWLPSQKNARTGGEKARGFPDQQWSQLRT